MKRLLIALAVLIVSACDSWKESPTSPTGSFVANAEGVYASTDTLTATSGGECLTAFFASKVGQRAENTFAITQDGSSLVATGTDTVSGLSCQYVGTASRHDFVLNATSCIGPVVLCPDGALRRLALNGASITASIDGKDANGTIASTYNVMTVPAPPLEPAIVGTLTRTGSLRARK
jgi:hypothetical protein